MDLLTLPTLLAALALAALTLLITRPTSLANWLRKKNYQYEVTFALYMLTPTEKFIFNSVLFLTLSMFTLATCLYLPDHVVTVSKRAYYYCAGGEVESAVGERVARVAGEVSAAAVNGTMGLLAATAGQGAGEGA